MSEIETFNGSVEHQGLGLTQRRSVLMQDIVGTALIDLIKMKPIGLQGM